MVNQPPSASLSVRKRRPSGSSFGQNCFAIAWLITAYGVLVIASVSVSSRPRTTDRPSVFSMCGDTPMYSMPGSLPFSNGTAFDQDLAEAAAALSGIMFDAKAACTPGSASTRRRMSSVRCTFDSGVGVLLVRHEVAHRHQRRRVEAAVGLLQVQEAAHEERGADQQQQRERDFGDDQRVADPGAAAAGGAAAAFLQRFLQIRPSTPAAPAQGRRRCRSGRRRRRHT